MPTRVITSEQELKDLILLGVTGKYILDSKSDEWPNGYEILWATGGLKTSSGVIAVGIEAGNYLLEVE